MWVFLYAWLGLPHYVVVGPKNRNKLYHLLWFSFRNHIVSHHSAKPAYDRTENTSCLSTGGVSKSCCNNMLDGRTCCGHLGKIQSVKRSKDYSQIQSQTHTESLFHNLSHGSKVKTKCRKHTCPDLSVFFSFPRGLK